MIDATEPHPLDKSDILVAPLDRLECEECGDPATHLVQADSRNVGQVFGLGILLEECADCTADGLRHGLLDVIPDGEEAPPR